MPPKSEQTLVVCHFGGKVGGLPLENVAKIMPMADLAQPPGLPAPLEGILNLAGAAVPVLRLDRLFQLPERRPGLYSMLVLLNRTGSSQIALLVDRVSEILTVHKHELLPVAEEDSFNACVVGTVPMRGSVVHVLSPPRILLERESQSLAAFRTTEELRLAGWRPAIQ